MWQNQTTHVVKYPIANIAWTVVPWLMSKASIHKTVGFEFHNNIIKLVAHKQTMTNIQIIKWFIKKVRKMVQTRGGKLSTGKKMNLNLGKMAGTNLLGKLLNKTL